MSTHTPGPWAVKDRGYTEEWVQAEDGTWVAVVSRASGNGLTTAMPNARLIASAPELLEVAKKLAAWESDPDGYGGDLAEIGCMARAAIAKAEGRSE